ncbi:XPG/Rad2 endonuclease [Parasponia andersonii]|uniref:XPG/Rad2 endonuclease n=1 Tax=Parasponia andersonii TaxID=3476 RepID=A0A2P5CUF1_PARAD|nr:XPG/Rad2 endonuclease [Parasponia andersonii]
MGVKNLWDVFESCKKTLPLHHLQNKRICIDLSCWMVQLQNVSKSHSCLKEKVSLKGLFHRLRALIALNCSLIFVTDGSIPAIKISTYRRRLNLTTEVNNNETNSEKASSLRRNMGSEFSCMIKEAKMLGMSLGIPCLDGMEEAEAQCALLNSELLCDGCFTSDSDIFLFGARTVYRDICLGDGYVVCYEMSDIEGQLGFGRNSLISLALFLGSDYSHGVHGLGRESACQIVKSIGDNVVLQKIASEGLSFAKKTKGSKNRGQNSKNNQENLINYEMNMNGGKKCSPEGYSFLEVMNAYLKPRCHSADSDAVHRVLIQHSFQHVEIQQICGRFFGWPPEKTDEYILPKIAERDLRRFANLRSTSLELGVRLPLHEMPTKCPVSGIIKQRKVQGKECYEVSWEEQHGLKTSIVPADLLKSACPEKIVEFEEEKAHSKKQTRRKVGPKKAGDESSMAEIDRRLRNLLLDIETGSNTITCPSLLASEREIPKNKSKVQPTIPVLNEDSECYTESGSNAITCPSLPSSERERSENRSKVDPTIPVLNNDSESHIETGTSGAAVKYENEIIDLLSPSPPRLARTLLTKQEENASVKVVDVIELSESETEMSPEHHRKAKELRLFIASIKD